jgi:hypothetical protein
MRLQVGAQFSEKPTPREFRQLVERLAGRPDGLLLESLVIRSLAQAVYQQTNIGHFGLALDEYAHFTSPIRRYPDLLVHRAIKAAVLPNSPSGHRYTTAELQTLGAESSQRERRADDASRDVMGYLKCLYMQGRVGETFDATITSALEFGLFVQLKEMPIDGLVHISAIPGDYWELENGGLGLVGQRTGRRWQLGDTVRVRLSRVDLTQRQIDFELLDADGAASHGTVRAPRRGQARRWRRRGAKRGPGSTARGSAARARTRRRLARTGGRRLGVTARARRAWLIRSAISFTACMPSTRCWNGRRSGYWNFGWRSRATMPAAAICGSVHKPPACGFSPWRPRRSPSWSGTSPIRERWRRCGRSRPGTSKRPLESLSQATGGSLAADSGRRHRSP